MSLRQPVRAVLSDALWWLVPAWLLLPFSWFLPMFDLTTPLAGAALFLSDSGKYGMPVVVALGILVVVTRPGILGGQRARETGAIAGTLFLFLGLGAVLNEYAVKPVLNTPRPNIAELAQRGLLPGSPEAFYSITDKAQRSEQLRRVLGAAQARLPMSPGVRAHWIEETGFSFPSGHSTAAMLVATFFFCMTALLVGRRRRVVLLAMLPWALAVCYARPVLRVHRPIDITLGALQGILLGLVSFWCFLRLSGHTPRAELASATDHPSR